MRRAAILFFIAGFFVQTAAHAEIGRVMTKRERERQDIQRQSPSVLYEKTYELFLREDYEGAEKLTEQYLSRDSNSPRAEDMREIQNLCREKIGQGPSPVSARTLVTMAPAVAGPTSPLKQIALEERPFYAVQVGSFSQETNAKALLEKLSAGRYDAYLTHDPARPARVRVRVGRLESREAAEALEKKLKKDGYPTKICLP